MTKHQPDRRVGGRTNAERAEDGGNALLWFAQTQYNHPTGEEIPTALGDLVCSLMHYLAAMGFDPLPTMEEAMQNGAGNYYDESEGEPHESEDGEETDDEPPFAEEPLYDPEEWMIHQAGEEDT